MSAAVLELRDKENDTALIGLIHKGSHRAVPSKNRGTLVPNNMLKCRTFEIHVLFVSPPAMAPGAQTFMGEDQPYGVSRH